MSLEKHGPGVEQSWRMLDLFASLDVQVFDLTWTDIDRRKQGFRRAESLVALRQWMPSLLSSAIR